MQGYSYSVFSLVAIAIHLVVNFTFLAGKGAQTERGRSYRVFLLGVLFYYLADGAWGVFAGLGWTRYLYADTILFFLSLVAFVFAWSRYVAVYLGLGKWPKRILSWTGLAILAANLAMLAANFSNGCFFHIDAQGQYVTGPVRNPAIALLVAYNALTAAFVLSKLLRDSGSARRRSLMVFFFSVTIALSIVLQIVWPLTPVTSLACLVCNCLFNVFVIQDEQATRHAAELEKALDRARAAEKARRMFFSIVSHDIRTPLNAILGYSELLRRGLESPVERDKALDAIHASGTMLLQLVNDVLDLSKIGADRVPLHPEPIRLSRLMDEVFASFRLSAGAKGIALENRTADVPTVLLDGHRFRQILFNLVGNAVKFTDRGTVAVSASYAGNDLELAVSDTGCGISPDMQAHIFDPFVQVEDPSHTAARLVGGGMGLSICRRLVEMMGGGLSVESEPGKGSTFKARIPGVETGAEKTAAEPDPAGACMKHPEHVLVVDDSPVNRAVLTAHLKKAGVAAVDQATDGEEALAKLAFDLESGHPHDFVFSDLWMPNVNGLEFVEKLRADSRFVRLPVFAVTADTEFRADPRHALFTGILSKPLTYAKLVDAFSALRAPRA
ncbi:response regulator [bacterium]|nr:response regulator [bacterium]MBP1590273.1 response regulator [Kiritimatiellia bacterium]